MAFLACLSFATLHAANCPPITFGPVPTPTLTVPAIFFQNPDIVQTADVNKDRNLDLVFCTSTGVYVMLGDGAGGFGAASSVVAGSWGSLAVADLNKDGNLDLIMSGSGALVRVALGNGNGTFKTPVDYPATASAAGAQFLAIADFNGDGKLDIATLLFGGGNAVSVLTGRGDGTFNTASSAAVTFPTGGLVAADFNGDGFIDLATVSRTNVVVLPNKGNGTFNAETVTPSSFTALTMTSLRVADFNGDGIPDLTAIANDTVKRFLCFLGKGDGTFTVTDVKTNSSSGIYNIAVADVTGDGRPDAVISSFFNVTVMENLGGGLFAGQLDFPETSVGSVVSGDFNKDGRPDVVAFGGDARARILLNETEFLPQLPVLTWLAVNPVRLVWYTNYPGYSLEYSPELGSAASWNAAAGSPAVVDCQYYYSIPKNNKGFYRLRKP